MASSDSLQQILLDLSHPSEAGRKKAEEQLMELAARDLPGLLQGMLTILWDDPDSDYSTAPIFQNVRLGLYRLGDPSRDALLAELHNRSHVRLASNALHHWRTDPLVRAGWTKLAKDPQADERARMNALYGLGIYPHLDSIETLLSLADDSRPVIRLTASRQFFGYKQVELQFELYHRWQVRENLSPYQRAALACGLVGNHPLGQSEILEQALADPHPWVRQELAYRLHGLSRENRWARPALLCLLTDDPDPTVRQSALESLCLRAKPDELNHFLTALQKPMASDSLAQMDFVTAFKRMGADAMDAVCSKRNPPNALWGRVAAELGR